MIQVESLHKHFGTTRAVDGLDFQVATGQVVGLLGPNGAGKTTTMKMLTCYLPPTSGVARVGGIDVVENPLEVRRQVGYLPENVPLYDDMGVIDYLDFVARARGLSAAERGPAIEKSAGRCGLEPVLHRNINELSKGFRQRLGLAQAIVHEPKLLILDEPTTGLDPNQIVEIRALIRELGQEKTVVLSTHILPEVEAVCDRVLIMHQGGIVADGSPAELHHRFQGAQELDITVSGVAAHALKKALSDLSGVEQVSFAEGQQAQDDDGVSCQITAPGDVDLRADIFGLCVDNGWVLLEQRRRVVSLEQIFRQLTRGEAAPTVPEPTEAAAGETL